VTRRRPEARAFLRERQARHPGFREAVLADLAFARRQRGETGALTSRAAVAYQVLRLAFVTDAFGALVCYRLKAACQRRGIPVVPRIAHRVAMAWAQLSIGDPVVVQPGVMIPHGQIVIDGVTEVHAGARLRPFITIGLKDGVITGPTIGRGVSVGTGAKIIGPITVGANAKIGANAVVVADVPPGAVVGGVPARVLAPPAAATEG
jgi:serine O-acetyltransferase